MIHVITVDDRERTPNYGKPLFNAATVLSAPPIRVVGFRAYRLEDGYLKALTEGWVRELPANLARRVRINPPPLDRTLDRVEGRLDEVATLTAYAYIDPQLAGLAQKKGFLTEVGVGGGDIKAQFEYLRSILGQEVRVGDLFKPGAYVDVVAITKGKGFEGVVTRFGVKRKHHKSRKTVREVAAIGPWHPAAVTYTVPRAGQRGFHQRTEYNKRVLMVGNVEDLDLTPKGGFPHFGVLRGDYIVLKGSVPGPAKRLITLRYPIRPPPTKIQAPQILEVSVATKAAS
jgi:large subunit ribosomal protein L3